MILQDLEKRKLIQPPKFLPDNTHYLTITGSHAYGIATDKSDFDVYGWCIPPKELVFPHLAGVIPGFGTQIKRFEQWQQHHIEDKQAGKEYDFTVYSIVRFFQLVMENNPNMIDALFTPVNCVIHATRAGELVRENRRMFLHKGSWHRFKGYSYQQIHKAKSQTREGKRKEMVGQFGYDLKFASHCVRLLNEVEQILVEGDLDLTRNSEQIKAIRRGDWTLEELEKYFASKERELEALYSTSTLRHSPDEEAIKRLLLNILEEHYGDLSTAVASEGGERLALLQISDIVNRFVDKTGVESKQA
jgi:predicted nucleotidyltransferase